ncbi:MAG: MFS transporter [Deltaproteobacteria bacterium]|nr:MFS transporter [Deltaproteobacteria bacterium]
MQAVQKSLDPQLPPLEHAASSRRWMILSLVLFTQVTISIVTQGIPTLSPFVQSDLYLTHGEVGLCNSAIVAGSLLALLAAGWVVDFYGEYIALVGGSIAVGIFCFVVAATGHFVPALVAMLGVGIGAAMPTPAGTKAVMAWFPAHQRGFALGIRQTGIPLGGAIAAAGLSTVAVSYGWRVAVAIAGVMCLIAAVFCVLFYENPPNSVTPGVTGAKKDTLGFREIVTRNIFFLGLAGALLPLGQFCLITYLALYLKETQGIPVTTSALLLVGAQIAGALGRILWGLWSDRWWQRRRKPALLTANALGVVGTLILGWLPPGVPVPLVAVVVLFLAFNAIGWHGSWTALLAELAGPERQGRTIGAAMTIMYPGIIALPPLFGMLVDLTHNWHLAWTFQAVVLLIGTLLILPVQEGQAT